jgi:hypothetical protein
VRCVLVGGIFRGSDVVVIPDWGVMFRGGIVHDGKGNVLLRCIHEYLTERGVSQASLYNGYIDVPRRRKRVTIAFTGETEVTCEVSEFDPGDVGRGGDVLPDQVPEMYRSFDMCDPGSLQAVFEFVMSKRNK